MEAEAMLGKTHFKIEDEPSPLSVKITRTNADGVKEFYIPKALVLSYARQILTAKAASFVDGLLK